MKKSVTFRLNILLTSLFLLFTVYLYFTGYFEIDLLSDDYLNLISANTSTLAEKFSGDVPYYSKQHFRPLWFMSIQFSSNLSEALGLPNDNFILYRAENLILLFLLTLAAAHVLLKLTKHLLPSLVMSLMVLTFPNILNSLCWTIGKVDLMTGIFMIVSLFFSIKYVEESSRRNLVLSAVFLLLGLLTKETAIITPAVCFLILEISETGHRKSRIKILAVHLALVITYLLFRIILTPATVTGVTDTYSDPSLPGRLTVVIQAVISLIIPSDYLTLQRNFAGFDLLTFSYLTLSVILAVSIFAVLKSRKSLKLLLMTAAMFLASIIPNFIAGYFRPQLILIPFILTTLTVILILVQSGMKFNFSGVIMSVIIVLWIIIGNQTIKDWLYASNSTGKVVKELLKLPEEKIENSFFIGFPGRFRQAHMAEYVTGPYNYFRFGLNLVNVDIKDAVHVSALDDASLNSSLRVESSGENEYSIIATGETQYFQITGSREHTLSKDGVVITLDSLNSFRKPIRMKVTSNGKTSNIYICSNNRISKLTD